jgi:uncharacterized membrane protein (DUF485 family)
MTRSERTLQSAFVPMIGFALVFFGVLIEHTKGRMDIPVTGNIISWALPLLVVAFILVVKSTIQEHRGE